MSTIRVLDWRPRLVAWAEGLRGAPFIWGKTDCATIARKALAVCFGRDIAPDIPLWRDLRQAATVLARYGNVPEVIEKLGAQRVTLSFARCGDIISMPEPEEPVSGTALGVWLDGFAVMSGTQGVMWVTGAELAPHKPTLHSLWEIPDVGAGPYG